VGGQDSFLAVGLDPQVKPPSTKQSPPQTNHKGKGRLAACQLAVVLARACLGFNSGLLGKGQVQWCGTCNEVRCAVKSAVQ
jgi:hypothetical protein